MRARPLTVACAAVLLAAACTSDSEGPAIDNQDVHLTLLHTADIHSRLLPYDLTLGQVDIRLGLSPDLGPFGGAARIATVVRTEVGRADRVLLLDSGDVFQGAPIFNFFRGEPEMRLLSLLRADAVAIGNHEFDMGGDNLYSQIEDWAAFPSLAANYLWEDPYLPYHSHLGTISEPYVIINVRGLRVGIIGLGNLSSMNSIFETDNRLGVTPLDPYETTQAYVELLKPQVDFIVVLSHLGLSDDQRLIQQTSDVDIVVGGHHHIVLYPPTTYTDQAGRQVRLVHSGAFSKYVGRVDLVVRQCSRIPECVARYGARGEVPPSNDWEVASLGYQLFLIDASVPDDPLIADVLERYVDDMGEQIDLNEVIGYAPMKLNRFSALGGDSAVGNLVASSIWVRQGVQTDFALTNSLGIRANLESGPVYIEQMYNIFPFENTITTMYLSGAEVQELFDFIARRSAGRGCNTQAQISGAAVVMACGDVCPPSNRREDGSCEVEREPRVQRVLIGDASPRPSAECRAVQDMFDGCCLEVARCGCTDDVCADSECEQRARAQIPGCDQAYEPAYRTTPCANDDECRARDGSQRCFVPGREARGRCMYTVVDDYEVVDPYGAYELAANDYIAAGGSGFRVLGRNTTQENLGIPLREAVVEYIRAAAPCTTNAPCSTDADCPELQVCSCDEMAEWDDGGCSWERRGAEGAPVCEGATGHCVLGACQDDVTTFRANRTLTCDDAHDDSARARCLCEARAWALAQCETLPCVSPYGAGGTGLDAAEDGRQRMVQP